MKTQLDVDFTPKSHQELIKLKSAMGVSSDATVLRFALRTLQWLIEQLESGASIQVNRDGRGQEVNFAFLDWARLSERATPIKAQRREVA